MMTMFLKLPLHWSYNREIMKQNKTVLIIETLKVNITIFSSFSGKVAWNNKFEEELDVGLFDHQDAKREAAHAVTFFTETAAAPHHVEVGPAPAQPVHFQGHYANPAYSRSARNTEYQQPIYYYSSN